METIKEIELRPTEDLEYLLDLSDMYKYDNVDREDRKKLVEFHGKYFWEMYDYGEKMGIIFSQYVPALHWTVDGYTDPRYDKPIKRRINVAIEAMKMVTEFLAAKITDVVRTTHHKDNKAASMICKRSGYKHMMDVDSVIGPHSIFEFRR